MSSKLENFGDKKNGEESDVVMDDSDFDDDDSPSKFRENVKKFLEEQRWAKAKANSREEKKNRMEVGIEKKLEKTEINNMVEIDDLIYDSDSDEEVSLELEEVSCDLFDVDSSVVSTEYEPKDLEEKVDSIKGNDKLIHNPETLELEEVSNDVFDTEEEITVKDVPNKINKSQETRSRSDYIEVNKNIFSEELEKIRSIPNPDDFRMSSQEFEKVIYHAFRKVLPRKVLSSVTSKKCGLCHEEFPKLREAWKHYRGHNHIRALKCHVKGTFKKHPPFFKMCLEAISVKESAMSLKDIYKFVTQKYTISYSEERTNQLITWGIERLVENKYVKDNGKRQFILDPALSHEIKSEGIMNLPSLEMASSARKERGAPRNFSIISFEKKINELFRKDLPYHVLKTLKPNHCGLCHLVIREKNVWDHYEGPSHRRMVLKTGRGISFKNRDYSFNRSEVSPRDRRDSDRFYRERERESLRRNHEYDQRRSRRFSREYSPFRERARNERCTPIRSTPLRRTPMRRSSSPRRRRSSQNYSHFTHRDSGKLPVFIDSSVGGERPRALMIPKADSRDFTREVGYGLDI